MRITTLNFDNFEVLTFDCYGTLREALEQRRRRKPNQTWKYQTCKLWQL